MSDPKLTRTAFAILGLLSLGEKSGYDIKREVETSIQHFWKESYGQIYPILKRLHDAHLVDKQTIAQEHAPTRLVYSITPEGKKALYAWLIEPTDIPVTRNELLLKLFFGQQMPRDINLSHIQRCRDVYQQMLQFFQHTQTHLEQETDPDAPYRLMTLRAGIYYCQAMVSWCDETEQRLHALPQT